jgi:hypothetical protein
MALAVAIISIAGAQTPPRWAEHVIATNLTGGYQVVAADMNGDGRRDLLALGSGAGDFVWFENPSWTRQLVARGIAGMINADVHDIDGDGTPEVALASGFNTTPARSAGTLSLITRGSESDPWTVREIDRLPTSHRLRWIDAEGSGTKFLINAPLAAADAEPPDYRGGRVPIAYYRAPDWKREIVTNDELGIVHGTAVVDWDGKGRESLLTAGFLGVHLHRFVNSAWQRTRLTPGDPAPWPKSGSSDVAVARAGRLRVLATIEPWHGHQVVVYPSAGAATRKVIDDTLDDGHTLTAADLDGDGNDELVAGQRGRGGRVLIYTRDAKGEWAKTVVAEKQGPAAGCAVADLNADKLLDIACIGGPRLVWYQQLPTSNLQLPR